MQGQAPTPGPEGGGRKFAPFFQRLIDDPATALARLRADPAGFEHALLAEERGTLAADGAIPAHAALGAMLFDRDGSRVALDGPDWLPPLERFAAPGDRATHDLLTLDLPGGGQVYAVAAPVAGTTGWNLLPGVREACARHPDGTLVLVAGGGVGEAPLDAAGRAFGLTDLERRVVSAVVRQGSGKRAAAALTLSYSTVREILGRATRRMGARNLPALVGTVVAAAFGVLPAEGDPRALLADMLPLSERQARIAALIASGLSRDDVARALGLSNAVVRKELEQIFAALGVDSASGLSRLTAELRALRLIARSTDSALGYFDPALEPTRFTPRPSGAGVVAWSDYGPRSGRPVLVVHSNWCCRSVPRPLLTELHARGFRPIAIDRPGFGATAVGGSTPADPFTQAVADALLVLDTLGVAQTPVIARCGAQFVLALKAAVPDRVGPVVLVSPTPQTADTSQRRGVVGVIKEAFYRSPRLIEFFFRIICAQISLKRVETLTRAIVAGSAVDEALCDDPAFLRDRLRAIRPLSTGNLAGAVNEEIVISHGGYRFDPVPAADWLVLQGSDDVHNSMADVADYWTGLLPGAAMEVVLGGGRFITSSHAGLVAERLARAVDQRAAGIPQSAMTRPAAAP